jgi:hypothetical protein
MSDVITLGDLDTELVFEAAIDGKTGANARHIPARRYSLLNRVYKQLRSLVSHNGEEFFRAPGTPSAIPARAVGEDWIELPWPTHASEIIGVDVQLSGEWDELSHGSWSQRRVFPGSGRRNCPGEWTTLSMPQPDPVAPTTVTAGKIVIWPPTLGGNVKIDTLPKWAALTDPTHVFVVFPDWVEWILAGSAMVITQRDNDRHNTFLAAKDRKAEAERRILLHCRRSKRGVVMARRRDGMEL